MTLGVKDGLDSSKPTPITANTAEFGPSSSKEDNGPLYITGHTGISLKKILPDFKQSSHTIPVRSETSLARAKHPEIS
jgi:hypothetical protein